MKKKISIFRKLITISNDTLERMAAYAMDGNPVFNPDDLRLQRHIRKTHSFVKQVTIALMEKKLLENRRVGSVVVMHSKAGCKRQAWHTDYDPRTLENAKTKPMGVILALQAVTFFATPHKTYELGAGDVLCFDGDVVHAGAAYEMENTRMHMYLDVDAVQRQKNRTWIVPMKRKIKRH